LQAEAPHAYAPHAFVVVGHPPAPLQVADTVSVPRPVVVLVAHESVPHAIVPAVGYTHAVRLLPLHTAVHSVPAPAPPQAGRAPSGLPTTGAHVPGVPGRLHDSHWPVHALLQHTPSTQKFEMQSEPFVQA
jgi:hypothetical protein